MYAIIETGGKQYRVEAGTLVQVESLPGEVGGTVELSHVRLVHGDKGMVIGQPLVKGARVTAEIIRQGRTRSAEELPPDPWTSAGFHQTAYHRYRISLARICHGNK